MAPERYQTIKRVFLAALDVQGDERRALLDRECAGDAALRADVERLLAEDLAAPTITVPPADGDLLWGDRNVEPQFIDKYRILSRLGEGGFGVVYLAEQVEPVRRRVALKIIKAGMDSERVIARFEAERQALAMMDHPNIARVLDAGTTPPEHGARPYFVMDHVAGEPITDYCDRHNLSVRDRLALFAQVCNAVHHAHAKGIIHRDLKPGNILVGVRDGADPIPKVIDFGVAKALHQRLTEETIFTEQGQVIGTPEYMSPEQAEMGSLDIDTRSDVYSLGVLLYELLVGARPFDLRKAAVAQIAKVIRETDPPRPSAQFARSGEQSRQLAARRRTTADALSRVLAGDLELIPLKAMRKDRTERYQSALEMAKDVQRYLTGQPLEAAPESAVYRARKFVRRHRAAVVGTSAVVVTLCVAAIVSMMSLASALRLQTQLAHEQASLAAEQTARAEEAEARAQAEAARASAERDARLASDFATQFFGSARRWGIDVSFRDAMTALGPYLSAHETALPGPVARARVALGHSFLAVNDRASATAEFEQAEHLARQASDPTALADACRALAGMSLNRGEVARALEYCELAKSARPQATAWPEDVADDWAMLGQALFFAGRMDDAESAFRAAREAESRVAPPRPDGAFALASLGEIASLGGDDDRAVRLVDQALEECRTRSPPDPWLEAKLLAQQGWVLRRAGRVSEALESYRRRHELMANTYGTLHEDTLAAKRELAAIQLPPQATVAADTTEDARRADQFVSEPLDPLRSSEYNSLALRLARSGDYARAAHLAELAIRAVHERHAEEPIELARHAARVLATTAVAVHRPAGNLRAAYNAANGAIDSLAAAELLDDPGSATACFNVALILHDFGDHQRALELCDRAPSHPGAARLVQSEARRLAGECHLAMARTQPAEADLMAALDQLESFADSWRVARARASLARCRVAQSRLDEAYELLTRACESLLEDPSPYAGEDRGRFRELADLCEALGHEGDAARWRARSNHAG